MTNDPKEAIARHIPLVNDSGEGFLGQRQVLLLLFAFASLSSSYVKTTERLETPPATGLADVDPSPTSFLSRENLAIFATFLGKLSCPEQPYTRSCLRSGDPVFRFVIFESFTQGTLRLNDLFTAFFRAKPLNECLLPVRIVDSVINNDPPHTF